MASRSLVTPCWRRLVSSRCVAAFSVALLVTACTKSRETSEPAEASHAAPARSSTAPAATTAPAGATASPAAALPGPSATSDEDDEASSPAQRETRLAVGEKAPNFELSDQHGNKVALADFVQKKKVALVFYRSADW